MEQGERKDEQFPWSFNWFHKLANFSLTPTSRLKFFESIDAYMVWTTLALQRVVKTTDSCSGACVVGTIRAESSHEDGEQSLVRGYISQEQRESEMCDIGHSREYLHSHEPTEHRHIVMRSFER